MRLTCAGFLLLSLLFSFYCGAQQFMDARGNNYEHPIFKNEVDSILSEKRMYLFLIKGGDMVAFQKLSNVPIWIFTNSRAKVPGLIKQFDYKKYLQSWEFKNDVQYLVKERALDTSYALRVLGKPDVRKWDYSEVFEEWIYKRLGLMLTFDTSMAIESKFGTFVKPHVHPVTITDWEVTGEDYSSGISIKMFNHSKKVIKYVWINTTAFNPVKDKIGTKTVQAIGPINPRTSGSWTFDDIYFSKVLDVIRITGLKIQYMDGSLVVIPSKDIGKIIVKGSDIEYW